MIEKMHSHPSLRLRRVDKDNDKPLEKDMCRGLLTKVISIGLLDRVKQGDETTIVWPKHTKDYFLGHVDLEKTLGMAIEHRMSHRQGDQVLVELLLSIWDIIDPNNDLQTPGFLTAKQIMHRLEKAGWDAEGYGKGGAGRSLREALRYATLLGLLKTDGKVRNTRYARNGGPALDTSSPTPEDEDDDSDSGASGISVRNRLRRSCEYWKGFRILRRMGPSHDAFTTEKGKEFRNDLVIYHMYRNCSGLGRQRLLADRLRTSLQRFEDVLRDEYKKDLDAVMEGGHADIDSYTDPYSKHSSALNVVINNVRMLKEAIREKCGVGQRGVPNIVTVDVLRSAYLRCENPEDLRSFFTRNTGTRYDKTILSESSQSHGGEPFCLPDSFEPYPWQVDATGSWKDNGYSGIVAAVTGSGKTIMAIHAISNYIHDNPEAVVTVIVPTKVLMYQWAEAISELLGLDEDTIGLRGDGFKDSFSDGKRIVVSIINSAREGVLVEDLRSVPKNAPHMLIADECHRYGGESNRTVFDARFDAVLGLSATPPAERETEDEEEEEDDWTNAEVVIERIGEVFYNLRYKEALEQNLISPFEVIYLSTPLEPFEDLLYDNHTKKIGKAIKGIRAKYGHLMGRYSNRSLDEQLNAIESQVPDVGRDRDVIRYRQEALSRRELVWDTASRKYAYLSVIERHEDSQVMVFHEQISQLEDIIAPVNLRHDGRSSTDADHRIQDLLEQEGYNPAMYHSKQKPIWNTLLMEMFRKGDRRVMLSVKALAEGVDVPAADVGIIRVSSGSVRQRIQTIGRMLRRGAADKARIYIFHVTKSNWEPTVDCNILRAVDWDEQLGQAEIRYAKYMPPILDEKGKEIESGHIEFAEMEDLPIPPSWEDRQPPAEVDVSDLEIGDEYPGRFDGIQIGVDAKGRPFRRNREFGRLFLDDDGLKNAARFVQSKKGGGKVLLTPQGHLVTLVKGEPTYFLGTLNPSRLEELEAESLAIRKEKSSNKPRTFEEMFGSE